MSAAVIRAALEAALQPAGGEGTRLGITGMLVVFGGLLLLTLALPLIRKLVSKEAESPAAPGEGPAAPPPTDDELTAAICAIHAHLASLDQIESVRLTLGLYDKPYRPWRLAGRAEAQLGRQNLQTRPRNRSL